MLKSEFLIWYTRKHDVKLTSFRYKHNGAWMWRDWYPARIYRQICRFLFGTQENTTWNSQVSATNTMHGCVDVICIPLLRLLSPRSPPSTHPSRRHPPTHASPTTHTHARAHALTHAHRHIHEFTSLYRRPDLQVGDQGLVSLILLLLTILLFLVLAVRQGLGFAWLWDGAQRRSCCFDDFRWIWHWKSNKNIHLS